MAITTFALFGSSLPDHCEPTGWFYTQLSRTFHTCIPTPLAFVSTLLGCLSITSWLFAQMPQIYKNWSIHSTSGLSIFFLAEWLLGDASNLLGCNFTEQATWQIVLASYYCFVDIILVLQWVWYEKLHHGRPMRKALLDGKSNAREGMMQEVRPERPTPARTPSKAIDLPTKSMFRMPRFSFSPSSLRRNGEQPETGDGSCSHSNSPERQDRRRLMPGTSVGMGVSPRTVLYVSMVLAVLSHTTVASPVRVSHLRQQEEIHEPSGLEIAGKIISWISTIAYLGSRLPQLYKNFIRRSTAGLSPHLFIAAFCGNLFYSSSLLTNPSAWADLGPYGGGGWADKHGTNREEWITTALPFWLGAAGVLFMDATIGLQFWYYGDGNDGAVKPIVIVEEDRSDGRPVTRRWRRVSGWMRGWVPSVSVAGTPRPGTPRSFSALSVGSGDARTNVERTGLLSDEERQGLLIAGMIDDDRHYSTM